MDQEPAVGMCASKILFADNPELVDSAGDDFFRFGASFSRHFYPASHPEVLAQRKCLFACAGACLYRKSMLREIGLFDEIYSPIYYEDSDLGFRAQIHGYDCLYVPTAIVLHRVSATTKRSSDTYIYVQMRNIEIFLLKNYPWGTYFLYLPMRLLVTLLVLLKYAMRGKGLLIVRAKLDFVRSIPGILRLRSEARRGRKVSEQTLASLLLPGWVRYKVRYFGKRVL
jgi:GT2 family glycosyltransferase